MRAIPWLVVVLGTLSGVAHATGTSSMTATGPASLATTEGRLVASDRAGHPADVPLVHTDVAIRVDGYLADATVTQQFQNGADTPVEAVYLFPLPDHAAVTEMTITIGKRTIRGDIHERAKAKQLYEAAKQKGFVAALLTEERPDLFTQAIANLEPHVPVSVTIRYVEPLAYADGGYELRFPMTATPHPGATGAAATVAAATVAPDQRSGHDISLAVDLDAGVPVQSLESPSHRIEVRGSRVQIAATDNIPNKDFVLRYRVAGAEPAFGALSYRDGDGPGSFLFVAQPPALGAATAVAPREIIFALDTSSSMRGAPLAKAKEVIRRVLATLRPDDTFSVVRFDDGASALGPELIANKPRNVALALDWVDKLDAGGATEMTSGIDAALALPHDPARVRIVALLTDGFVGDEDAIVADVAAKAGASRVFAFGVGSAVNHWLLDELADAGRGAVHYVRPDEDTATAVDAFRRRIDAPVLTDVSIDWGGLAVSDVAPHALPDLFAGQPLTVSGHYARGGNATVTVHARRDGRDVSFAVPVSLADHDASRPAIAQVWARRRIGELERALSRKDDPAMVADVIALSVQARVLTRYTAFVAVDDSHVVSGAVGGGAAQVVVPIDVPEQLTGTSGGTGSYGTIGNGYGYSYAYGSADYAVGTVVHTAPVVDVVIAAPKLAGSLDKAVIRRYVHRHVDQIRYCYEKQLPSHPTLDGDITAHFTIAPDGKVTASTADGMDDTVAACVAGVVQAIEFPAWDDSGTVQVNYPLHFHKNEVTE
jgi:Ca-activated chloride channel family protein|nr:VIT domain-containing protein [Kofleriaceae bacterium]